MDKPFLSGGIFEGNNKDSTIYVDTFFENI